MISALDVSAQKGVYLYVNHYANGRSVVLDQRELTDWSGRTYKLARVEYYLSGFTLFDGIVEDSLQASYALVNAGSFQYHYLGQTSLTNADSVRFQFGIDSVTNHADPTQWDNDNPLSLKDPSMHWGWLGGYRFIAVEGLAAKDINGDLSDPTRFEYHVVGDKYFRQFAMSITPRVSDDSVVLIIDADYGHVLDSIDISTDNLIHGGLGGEPQLVQMVQNIFSGDVFQPASQTILKVQELNTGGLRLFPNPVTGAQLYLETNQTGEVSIYNSLGHQVFINSVRRDLDVDVSSWKPGIYFTVFHSETGSVQRQTITIGQ